MVMVMMEDCIRQYLRKFKEEHPETNWKLDIEDDNNMRDCISYIYSEVKKAANSKNMVAAQDDYVFGLAIHFFDENIKPKENIGSIDVLTEQDIKFAKEEAKKEFEEEEKQSELEKQKKKQMEKIKLEEKKRLRAEKAAKKELEKNKDGYETITLF